MHDSFSPMTNMGFRKSQSALDGCNSRSHAKMKTTNNANNDDIKMSSSGSSAQSRDFMTSQQDTMRTAPIKTNINVEDDNSNEFDYVLNTWPESSRTTVCFKLLVY